MLFRAIEVIMKVKTYISKPLPSRLMQNAQILVIILTIFFCIIPQNPAATDTTITGPQLSVADQMKIY